MAAKSAVIWHSGKSLIILLFKNKKNIGVNLGKMNFLKLI
jgi:hypothetical protein